jgi:hypothetical protein
MAKHSAFGDTANPRAFPFVKVRDTSETALASRFQMRTLRSLLPDASQRPFGLIATESTRFM